MDTKLERNQYMIVLGRKANIATILSGFYSTSFQKTYTPVEIDEYIQDPVNYTQTPFTKIMENTFRLIKELKCDFSKEFLDEMKKMIYDVCFRKIPVNSIDFVIDRKISENFNSETAAKLVNKKSPIVRSSLYPEKLSVKTSKLSGVPITQRKVSIDSTPLLTVSTYDKEEDSLPPELKSLLLDPKSSIKNLIDLLEGVTAQRKLLQMKYYKAPDASNVGKISFIDKNLAKLDGLSDLDQVRGIKSYIEENRPSDLVELPIDLFPLTSSFRRCALIPKDSANEFYEFKLPGESECPGEDKRNIYKGDFYAGVQLHEAGIPKDYLYTPVAMITLHNIEKSPILFYNTEFCCGIVNEKYKKINDINIIIYKRPDGIRLPEIIGTFSSNKFIEAKQNYKFIDSYLTKGSTREKEIKKMAINFYNTWGFLNGAIGLPEDHLGNYILTKEGKVVSVNDIDRDSKKVKNYFLLANYLESIPVIPSLSIRELLPKLLEKNNINNLTLENIQKIYKESLSEGKNFREKYIKDFKQKQKDA